MYMSRPYGSAAELERRRYRAVEAVHQGDHVEDVARIFGITKSSVYRWLQMAKEPDGLAARQRIADLVYAHFGVSWHHDHVGRFLHQRLDWTPQKPHRRTLERDEAAIRYWQKHIFPRIASGARWRGAHRVFLDESGFMLTPTVRRTWAPRGQTPVLSCWDRRDRLSVISCITVSPRKARLNLYFEILPDNAHGDIVSFQGPVGRSIYGDLKSQLSLPCTAEPGASKMRRSRPG
jgi:transposase